MTKLRTILAGTLTALVCLWGTAALAAPNPGDNQKLDHTLNGRANQGGSGTSRVIVMIDPGAHGPGAHGAPDYTKFGGTQGRHFNSINADLVSLPNGQLKKLAADPNVDGLHWDRPVQGTMNLAAVTLGARAVNQTLGYKGEGIGVAVIDSGVTNWHDDLSYQGKSPLVKVVNGQRVVQFVDFVNGRTTPYDDYGHGTHVSGIIAGNGFDSSGARAGIAPAADIISLKALDANGGGYISNVISALDWVDANYSVYNIRVVNISIGAPVTESYWTDPLALATKAVVDAGVVVVAAAGNLGRNPNTGQTQYGAITAPGNAPWVLTVGADSDMGTITRTDDTMAPYSSRGPTAIDYGAKPDVVAPGTGIVSLAASGSTMSLNYPQFLLSGATPQPPPPPGAPRLPPNPGYKPYLSLTGTSMAAPMVTGTIALMMQANPGLTPNLAKAIVEYTAQDYGYDPLTQGAGFLNTFGAVQLAAYLAHPANGSLYPSNSAWSKSIIWGNQKLTQGVIKPAGNAYGLNIEWGTTPTLSLNIVWGTDCADSECDNIVWGTDSILDGDNIVWGTSAGEGDNIVWGTSLDGDNIVWGTSLDGDNIVWGTSCGGNDCVNIVWGTSLGTELDNIVWGTSLEADNIVWGTSGEADNIVWGTSIDGDNIVWGTSVVDSSGTVTDDMTDYSNVDFTSLFAPVTTTAGGGL